MMKFVLFLLVISAVSTSAYNCSDPALAQTYEDAQSKCVGDEEFFGLCIFENLDGLRVKEGRVFDDRVTIRWGALKKLFSSANVKDLFNTCRRASVIKSKSTWDEQEPIASAFLECSLSELQQICENPSEEGERNQYDCQNRGLEQTLDSLWSQCNAELAFPSLCVFQTLEALHVREGRVIPERVDFKWSNIKRLFKEVDLKREFNRCRRESVVKNKRTRPEQEAVAQAFILCASQTVDELCAETTSPGEHTGEEVVDVKVGDFHRTIIIVYKETVSGQDVVIRGARGDCAFEDVNGGCEIDITLAQADPQKWPEYAAWSQGNNQLSWEPNLGQTTSYNNKIPLGTPLRWTTINGWHTHYDVINNFGYHYWIAELDMDCSDTDNGWFQFQAGVVENNQVTWEVLNGEQGACEDGQIKPLNFNNPVHYGLCGTVNKVTFGSNACEIDEDFSIIG